MSKIQPNSLEDAFFLIFIKFLFCFYQCKLPFVIHRAIFDYWRVHSITFLVQFGTKYIAVSPYQNKVVINQIQITL